MAVLGTLRHCISRRLAQSGPRCMFGRCLGWCACVGEYVLHAQSRNAQAWQNALQLERRAKRKSLCLLLKQLSAEQRREFRASKQFHVTGGSTGVRYRIRVDPFSNIDVLYPNGHIRHQLCAYPTGDVPVYDKMAAQLLHLQDPATETRFLQKANILPVRAGHRISSGLTTWHG